MSSPVRLRLWLRRDRVEAQRRRRGEETGEGERQLTDGGGFSFGRTLSKDGICFKCPPN